MMLRSAPGRISDDQTQRIMEMIEAGGFNVGDLLPGQRELAQQLNVGRSTLRESIRHLEALGVLETHPGIGTYVVRNSPYSFDNQLQGWLTENKDQVIKIFEIREALESKAAELSAIKANLDDIEGMRVLLNEMDEAIGRKDFKRVTLLDFDFHDAISKSAGNDLLYQMIETICGILSESRGAVLALPGRAARSLNEHRSIFTAIEARQPQQAKDAMIQHLINALADAQEILDKS